MLELRSGAWAWKPAFQSETVRRPTP